MKIQYIVVAAVLIAQSAAVVAADYGSKDGNVQISAPVIEYATPKISASGGVHLEARDPVAKSNLVADAKSISVTLGNTPGVKAGSTLSIIKTAYMQGPLKMVFTSTQAGGTPSKSTASADKAEYDSVDGLVTLTGNVKITNENPALFDAPAVATGEKATINLRPGKEGESAFRFRIESTTGMSRVEVTPKQQQNQDGK